MKNPIDRWRGGLGSLWSPERDLFSLQRGIDQLFDDFISPQSSMTREGQSQAMSFVPQVDVEEQENQYLVCFDLPGMKKEDLKIEFNDNVLTVSGERTQETSERKGRRRFSERRYGAFQRSFTLPNGVNPESVQASYQDGELVIVVPKGEASRPRRIEIGESAPKGLARETQHAQEKKKTA